MTENQSVVTSGKIPGLGQMGQKVAKSAIGRKLLARNKDLRQNGKFFPIN